MLPLVVLAVVRLVNGRPRLLRLVLGAGLLGLVAWAWVAVDTWSPPHTLIVDFDATGNPWVRAWRWLLPDERVSGLDVDVRNVVWGALVAVGALFGWRAATAAPRSAGGDEDAIAGEGADADGVAVDLDRGRAVR